MKISTLFYFLKTLYWKVVWMFVKNWEKFVVTLVSRIFAVNLCRTHTHNFEAIRRRWIFLRSVVLRASSPSLRSTIVYWESITAMNSLSSVPVDGSERSDVFERKISLSEFSAPFFARWIVNSIPFARIANDFACFYGTILVVMWKRQTMSEIHFIRSRPCTRNPAKGIARCKLIHLCRTRLPFKYTLQSGFTNYLSKYDRDIYFQ